MEKRDLPPAAVRSLAEAEDGDVDQDDDGLAEERRAAVLKVERPKEINGRKGPEPTRYGDWESKGIASDF